MRYFLLLSLLLLTCCQQRVEGTPEAWKQHCAAAAQIRVDRHMNTAYRLGGAYDPATDRRKFEKECLEQLKQEQKSRSNGSQY